MKKKLTKLLYRSFDDTLSPAEKERLDSELAKSKVLQEEREKILALRSSISYSSEISFKPFFADRVINHLKYSEKQEMETFFDSLLSIFRPVAIATTVLILIMTSYNMLVKKNEALANAVNQTELTLEQVLDPTYILIME